MFFFSPKFNNFADREDRERENTGETGREAEIVTERKTERKARNLNSETELVRQRDIHRDL